MPLSKFLLRNEYCLADPELYKAADKNDPEALLEGVAMAGLVGVLRQLGDLAEFAAGIFNDLHEELMATASRGHELKIRVQQLEAEFPSVEKAFFTQTDHSLFLYNEGIDWHPNLRADQNLIARGNLPRAVMDSYEECRGPPRLFLLDKFDIAGAGACLKRYSDPSFFKAELTSSESTNAESQREKKARKARRKGSNWRIRETPEGFAKSHAKLHQLFSEERNQTDINVPVNRVKLKKRQLNGFLFDTISGKSYMERFLETHSAKHEDVREVFESSPRLKMISSDFSELGSEVELCTRSPVNQLAMRDSDSVPSPNSREKILEICNGDLGEDVIKETRLEELPVRISDIELEKVSSNFYKVEGKEEKMVIGESKTERKADGYRSDDITSEIDNYVDALTTMESEIETDIECKPKNERGFFHIGNKRMSSKRSEERQELQVRFSDSHSVGNSSASDEGTNSFRKGRSSFSYSDSPSSSAENVLSDGYVAAKLDPSTEFVDISSAKLGTRSPEHLISNGTFCEVSEVPSYGSAFGEVSRDSSLTDSTFTLTHTSEKESTKAGSLGLSSNSEEVSNHLSGDLPYRISVSDFPSHSRDYLPPVVSVKGQPARLLDMGFPNEFYDSFLHLPNFPNLTLEQDNDDAFEEMLPKEYDENNCSRGDLVNGKLGSSSSFGLPSEEQLHDLAEQDLETDFSAISPSGCLPGSPNGSDLDAVKSGDKKANLSLGEGHLKCGDFEEQKVLEITNEVPPSEFVSTKVGITCSEVGGLNCEDVSSECTVSRTLHPESETQVYLQLAYKVTGVVHKKVDGSDTTAGCNLFNSLSDNHINLQEKHLSCNRDSDQFKMGSQKSCSEYLRCSDAQKAAVDLAQVSLSDSKPMLSNPELLDPSGSIPNFVLNRVLVEDQSRLHLSDGTRAVTSLGEGEKESELSQSQNDVSANVEDAPSPSTHSPLEPGVPFREALESQAEQHYVGSLHADGEGLKLSNPESDNLQLPSNTSLRDNCVDGPLESVSSEHLRQLPESQFLEVLACHKVESSEPLTCSLPYFPSFDLLHGAPYQQLSEPRTIRPVLDIPLPDREANVTEIPPLPPLPPIEWRIGKLQHRSLELKREMVQSSLNPFSPVTTGEQAQWSFPELDGELEQPLNPFLAMNDEKLLNSSENRESVQCSPNPFSLPVIIVGDEMITQDFHALERKVAQPLNSFLSSAADNEKSPHCSLDSGGNLVHPDSNEFAPLPTNEDVNAQDSFLYLEGEVVHPSNLIQRIEDSEYEKSRDSNESAPLPTNEGVNAQQSSLDLEGEGVQPLNSLPLIQDREAEKSLDEFSHSSNNVDVNDHHSFLNLEGKVAQPMNSLLLIQNIEKPGDTSLTSEEEKVHPSYQYKRLTMEDEKPRWSLQNEKPQHVSLSLEEGMTWQPNLYVMQPFEEEKPKGSLKAWLHRPRDPLIQAVASHDKSTMRKVSDLVQPQVEPKVEERDSLLQQIRAKSFNLKPTVKTRPSIQAPKSNLRVSAILEKANAIRQALAGSDEDDDSESWSDS